MKGQIPIASYQDIIHTRSIKRHRDRVLSRSEHVLLGFHPCIAVCYRDRTVRESSILLGIELNGRNRAAASFVIRVVGGTE